MTNIDSILKSRDITLPTKVRLVKAMVFPVVMYGCESWTVKKAEHWRIDAFELWCWRRLLRVLWTARRFNQSILKEISPGCSLERLMLKLKNSNILATWCDELTHWKRPCCWERLRAGGEGDDRDEMVGWPHLLNGLEFEWTPGVGDGQGGLVCCDSRDCKESDTNERLNWTDTTGDNLFRAWIENKLQSISQSQTCTKKRLWSVFGGLLPLWSTAAAAATIGF